MLAVLWIEAMAWYIRAALDIKGDLLNINMVVKTVWNNGRECKNKVRFKGTQLYNIDWFLSQQKGSMQLRKPKAVHDS